MGVVEELNPSHLDYFVSINGLRIIAKTIELRYEGKNIPEKSLDVLNKLRLSEAVQFHLYTQLENEFKLTKELESRVFKMGIEAAKLKSDCARALKQNEQLLKNVKI